MKIGNLLVNATYLGDKVLTAIAVGATKVWEGVSKYIKFKDPVVEQLCMQWSSDGIGLTPEDAAKVTDIGTTFSQNVEITSFDELERFTGLSNIGGFRDCGNLKTLRIPKNATSIGSYAFTNCPSLTDIGDISNIKTIGSYAFQSTPNLNIQIDSPMDYIPSAFASAGITKASFVYATSANPSAFVNCKSLKEVYMPKVKVLPVEICRNTHSLIHADISSAVEVSTNAFREAFAMEEIVADFSKMTHIGHNAFDGCPFTIETLSIPSLQSIGGASFCGVKIRRIESLGNIPSLHHSSSSYGFGGTFSDNPMLELVNIPSTVSEMYSSFYRCANLKTVVCRATNPPVITTYTFGGTQISAEEGAIYVPDESVEAYKSATNWSAYADLIKPLSEYVEPTTE